MTRSEVAGLEVGAALEYYDYSRCEWVPGVRVVAVTERGADCVTVVLSAEGAAAEVEIIAGAVCPWRFAEC